VHDGRAAIGDNMNKQKTSLIRIISNDYPSLLAVLSPIIFWAFTAYFFYSGNSSTELFLPLSAGITLVAIPVLIWRYRMIASVFEDGMETLGTIQSIYFFRGRGRVEYVYSFQGQKYASGNAINRSKYTRILRDGQPVTVFVNPENPKRAFVKEIYL